MRATLLLAIMVGVTPITPQAAYASGADPHAKSTAAPQAQAPKPHALSPSHAEPDTAHGATTAAVHLKDGPGTPPKEPGPAAADTDLLALRDRIHARVAELQKSRAATKRTPPAPTTTRARHTAGARPAVAPPQPRIDLVWRPSVIWPPELDTSAPVTSGSEPERPAAAPDRVSVAWGPQE